MREIKKRMGAFEESSIQHFAPGKLVDIMLHLPQYVPLMQTTEKVLVPGIEEEIDVCKESLHRILLGGDQLTAARARAAIRTRVNSLTCATRMDGLIPCAKHWHTKVNLLDVS